MSGETIEPEGHFILRHAGPGKDGQGYGIKLVPISRADFLLLKRLEKVHKPNDEIVTVNRDMKNNVAQGVRVHKLLSTTLPVSTISVSEAATTNNLARLDFDWKKPGRAWLVVSTPLPMPNGKNEFRGEATEDIFIMRGKDVAALQKSLAKLVEKQNSPAAQDISLNRIVAGGRGSGGGATY